MKQSYADLTYQIRGYRLESRECEDEAAWGCGFVGALEGLGVAELRGGLLGV